MAGTCDGRGEGADRRLSGLTFNDLSDKMSYMGSASVSVRELQQNLKRVMARAERGEIIEVTRRGKPVARLAPARPTGPTAPWPDLKARRRAVFGDRIIAPGGSDVVIEGRDDR
jgi:prevent-host-death family protein